MIIRNDTGTIIRLYPQAGESIAGAANVRIYFTKPSGDKGYWDATINVPENAIEYTAEAGDFDQIGKWYVQGYLELPAWTGRTTTEVIEIGEDI
jgi:hypothetical protein